MANLRNFLIPVSVALAGLTAGAAQATINLSTISVTKAQSDQTPSRLAALPQEGVSRIIFATGGELHALILARNEQREILPQHESHASHASHASHRSHTSGY